MRFRPVLDRSEREKLRIAVSDFVVFNNEVYEVLTVGLRYARLKSTRDGSILGLAKLTDMHKMVAGEVVTPLDEFTKFAGTALFNKDSLLKK